MNAVTYDPDFYADDFIRDPIPRYADMRQRGPVLWLPHQNAYAVTRHAEVVEVLNRTKSFLSGKGISMVWHEQSSNDPAHLWLRSRVEKIASEIRENNHLEL